MKGHLNSESYPYYKMNVDFSKNSYAHLYEMNTRFQSSYYNRESQPFLTPNELKMNAPFIVVDLSNDFYRRFLGVVSTLISRKWAAGH